MSTLQALVKLILPGHLLLRVGGEARAIIDAMLLIAEIWALFFALHRGRLGEDST